MRHSSVPVKRGNGHAEMRIKTFVIVITAIMMMAVTPSFAQEENGFKKFNVTVTRLRLLGFIRPILPTEHLTIPRLQW